MTSATIRLTAAQALVRAMAVQHTSVDGKTVPLFGGVWAIFGHGNVAASARPCRACVSAADLSRPQRAGDGACGHWLCQGMRRRRMMACTTSIGPGATNLVTAAAVAHVNRLPVLLMPGDVFANRGPDPVLQQVEDFGDGTV